MGCSFVIGWFNFKVVFVVVNWVVGVGIFNFVGGLFGRRGVE